jgi:hypothetical protein
VTLWLVTLVTLANHNVTSVHKTKIPYERERRKATCDIVVGQCYQCHHHNVTQVPPVISVVPIVFVFFFYKKIISYLNQILIVQLNLGSPKHIIGWHFGDIMSP